MKYTAGKQDSIATVYFVVLAVIGVHLSLAYTILVPPMFDYALYADGLVGSPYNTRPLMAWLFQLVGEFGVDDFVRRYSRGMFSDALPAVVMLVSSVSLFGIGVWNAKSIQKLLPESRSLAWWLALLAVWMCYAHFLLSPELRFQTPYDILQVAFFSLGLYLIITDRFGALCALLIVATLNKETALFLGVWYGAYNLARTEDRQFSVMLRCSLLILLWATVRYYAADVFPEQAAVPIAGVAKNIGFILNPLHVPTLWSVFGFCWVPILLRFKSIHDSRVRACLWTFLPWFGIMIVLGDLLEIRIHSEFIPLATVALSSLITDSLNGSYFNRGASSA